MDVPSNTALENELQPKMRLSGKIVKITLAGAVVDIGRNLPGVIHISQLREEPVNRVEDVVQIGQTVEAWVRRVHENRIELTMIQPLSLEWREIKPEMVVKGKVTRIESYGAFVDIGAERPGLVHVSEIAHGYVKSPDQVLHPGDEVEAKVLEVNRRKKQIRLSIKATLPKPEEKPVQAKSDAHKKRDKKRKRAKEERPAETEPVEPEPTVMEMAYREALAKVENKKSDKEKTEKQPTSEEQENILDRTLENRISTG